MATTPAPKRTPRRRASAPATDVPAADAPAADAAPALNPDAAAPAEAAAKPARKAAAKPAAKAAAKPAAKKTAKPVAKAAAAAQADAAPAAEAATEAEVPAAPARKKAAKPAAKAAPKAGAKPAAADAPADAPPVTEAAAPAKAPAAKKAAARPAAKKTAARKAAAKSPAGPAAPDVAQAAEPLAAAEPAPTDAPAATAPDAAPEPTPAPAPARKRSPRKSAAAKAVAVEPAADALAAPATEAAAPVAAAEPATPAAQDSAEIAVEVTERASADAGDAPAAVTEAPEANASASDSAEASAADEADADSDDGAPDAAGAAGEGEPGSGPSRSRNRRNRRRGRDRQRGERAERPAEAAPAQADVQPVPLPAEPADTAADDSRVDAVTSDEPPAEAPAAPPAPVAPAAPARPPRPAPSGVAHSTLRCVDGDRREIIWHTGDAASDALFHAALERLGTDGRLGDDDDDSLPRLLRQASDEGHRVDVDPAVWAQLAARRDARTRAGVLLAAYPDGPASPALRQLLAAPLPLFQAEGALWAVVAGRGLLADERGLGKSVQAIATAQLWRRHFGLRRVAVISGAGERLAWQRAWRRFAGLGAQVMEGGLHQRQAAWSQAAEVRILAPEALASDAAHLAHWAPELVIVDEPQRLALDAAAWAALDQAPQALVLCGAPLDDQPALLEQLVAWLDRDRLGALAALREVQAAREGRATLGEADVERVSDALSRSVLQRQRAEVAEQLPAVVYSERIVPLAPAQREAHERHLATLRRGLSGWQASGYLADSEQWRLATTLRAALAACHRADPAVETSPLADAVVQALAEQLQAWAPGAEAAAPLQVAVLCETEADAAQLGTALQARGLARAGVELLAPGQAPSAAPEAVLQVGVPWRARRGALLPAGAEGVPGQQWLLLVAHDSLETALFDTLAARSDVPRSAAEPGSRGFLQGERLLAWLQAVQLALQAMPAAVPPVGAAG